MIKNIFKAFNDYLGTLRLISTLNLWKYFFIPIAISFGILLTISLGAWSISSMLGGIIDGFWEWIWGASLITWVTKLLGGLIVFAVGSILYKHILLALCAPYMSIVSEKIERHLYGDQSHLHQKSSFSAQLWRGIRLNTRNLIMELLLSIPLLILKFIPGLNLIAIVLSFLLQAYYAGFGNMDYTLERHFSYRESIRFVQQNKGAAIGNGIGFLLLLMIPVVGIFLVMPLSVTAGTRSTLKELELDDFKPPSEFEYLEA